MKRKPAKPRRPVVETLEPRILYSADFAPLLLDHAAPLQQAEQRTLEAGGEFAANAVQTHTSAPAQTVRHEVVFVDTATPDYQKLVQDITGQQSSTRQIEVVLLDSRADGIKQISDTLAGRHDIDAVHIISHGADGAVQLGNTTLNFDSLLQNASQIKGWGQALAHGADLLLYGCDVAQYADGKAMVDALSRLTGADVAASENLTGASAKGGDWKLEYQDGHIETGLAVSVDEQKSYDAVLQSVAAGTETRANTTTSGTQESGTNNPPHIVATDANGNYVVVWDGNGTQTGQVDTAGIYFQRYNANGVAQGSETRVNTTTANTQNWPAVAMDANGNFVIAWTSANQDGSAGGIYAQRYNASGVAQGGEFRVNTTTANDEAAPVIAMNTNGFVIAWNDSAKDGSGSGVYAQRYNASGVAQGGEFQVNVTTAGNQWTDSAAMDASGNFIISWTSGDENTAPYQDVYFRRYNASGTALTSEVRANTTTAGDQNFSNVAMNASGAFVITWEGSDGSNDGIYAQRYDSSGVAQGSEFRVNTTTGNEQHLGTAAMDSSGNFVIAWSSYGQDAAGTWGVYKQDYNADGTTNGGETRVNTTTAGDQAFPSIVMNGSGQYVVAWSGDGPGDSLTSSSTTLTSGGGGTSVAINNAGGGVFFQRYATALVVDTASDTVDGTTTSIAALLANKGADGKISLREAMLAANNSANVGGPDRIYFNIAGAGVQTINLTSALPNVTGAVIIDGSTQPGFAGTPLIALNGTSAGATSSGLTLAAGSAGSTIRSLAIYGFGFAEIKISGSSNNLIAGDFLGTDASGTVAKGGWAGINIQSSSSNNIIGGTTAADRNIISGNSSDGVQIQDAGTNGNIVEGNYIGLDVTGTLDLGNTQKGVSLWGTASNNTIGGTAVGAGNVISGNNGLGIEVSDAGSTGNLVQGNLIGTNAAGTAAIGNSGQGVFITNSASGNTIGGTTASARNVISGNTGNGISVTSSSSNELIEGNYIGLNAAGTAAIANLASGISVDSTSNNLTIGGTVAGAGNVISGNSSVGIWLNSTSGTLVQGNYIGLNAAGTAAVGNGQQGITLNAGATLVTIGGTTSAARNVISGNSGNGININDGDNDTIQGNYIGLNSTGTAAVANASAGIGLFQGAAGSQNNVIGGSAAGAGNVISGNTGNGINLQGASSSGNTIQGNKIGTDAGGTIAVANGQYGIQVNGPTTGTLIGGTSAGQGNLIANNGKAGVGVAGASTGGVAIEGNSIYANTALGIDLNNDGVTANDIGDADTGANTLQNFPVLSGAATTGSQITIAGTLNSTASRSYRIEFFSSSSADASGYGEGQQYLGFTTVTTDGSGNASFSPTLTVAVANGKYVSATATDLTTNDTSEFGLSLQVVNHAPVLSGANSLTAINEDPSSNAGTLVSALIAGKVSDSDPNALAGIAVSAVDNTNGAWQYSTNGGTTWNAFGSPTNTTARLLAADANTYVRFVPNAN